MLARCRKILALFALVTGCLHASSVLALGLGEITVYSKLNEPLDASIQILGLDGLSDGQIAVRMGSVEDFERAGAERVGLIDFIDIEIIILDEEEGVILLSTDEPVEEPFLSMVVSVRWPSGRLMRNYNALLDLPNFISSTPPQAVQMDIPEAEPAAEELEEAVEEAAEAPEPAIQPQSTASAEEPETPGADTQEEVAPEPEAMPAPEPEPLDGEQQVASEDAGGIPDLEPRVEDESGDILMDADADEVIVQQGDTLYDIAEENRPGTSVSIEQTMLAIQRNNPDAFIDNNPNMIMVGRVLRIPTIQEIRSIDQSQALNQLALENQASSAQPLAFSDNNSTTTEEGADELTILSGDEGTASLSGDSDLAETIAALENQLAISEENLDRARMENEELRSRYAALEEQIEILQNIIAMQDERLAQLQADLAARDQQETGQAQPEEATPAAAQPVAAAPAPQPVDNSLVGQISRLFEDTLVLLSSLVALIVLVVGFLVWRRRAAMDEMDEFELGGAGAAVAGGPEAFLADDDEEPAGFLATLKARFSRDSEEEDDVEAGELEAEEAADADEAEESDAGDNEDDEVTGLAETDETDDSEAQESAEAEDAEPDEDVEENSSIIYYDDDEEEGGFLAKLKGIFSRSSDDDEDDEDDEEFDFDDEDERDVEEDDSEENEDADGDEEFDFDEDDEDDDEDDEDDEEDELDSTATLDEDEEDDLSASLDTGEFEIPELTEEDIAEPGQDEDDVFEIEDDGEIDLGDFGLDDEESDDETSEAAEAGEENDDEASDALEFSLDDSPDESAQEEAEEAPVVVEGVEFSLDDTASEPEASEEPEEPAEVEGLDFKLSETESEPEAAETSDDQSDEVEMLSIDDAVDLDDSDDEEKSGGDGNDDGLDLDLGNIDIDDSLFEDDDSSGEEPISDRDESSTKLDLAVAYQAMGDLDGAKEILNEVIAEGNDEQVAEAKKLLESWDQS